jgi:flagellar biosynthesis/type III secretory pathway chaperone
MQMPFQRPDATVAPPVASPELVSALEHGLSLHNLLQEEFEALRVQDLQAFEALQGTKLSIFNILTSLTGAGEEHSLLDKPEWDTFKNLINDCRDMHRRNEVLISRKLDAIRGTLNTLRGTSDPAASVDVYDRLGRMSRRRGSRGYEDA